MPIKIVLAEDNYLVREGVARLLETEPTLNLVAAVEDLPGLLKAVEEHSPQVVITDIRMPPTSTDEGIQASELLRDSHPEVGVVVLSQYAEPEYAL
ncbi:MAG TPA: response regulator transcription factor, partial [Actinomycetota bacterium]|nr:response regulator transcription factor [Actinomycetota bacterium]